MPLTRYQIRNEFQLADPDLYRASDKDDPEALLEGVAMAGLVGILRQLGDLAEFAAEIFHDLHEEVMATAARGHGLMARIQQMEADVPLIEKNLLSRTDHTAFYYNAGVDWRPQMCTDQNLITQGDMPRFIRDSYEECRGPPQLFLLDKFDTGGAGACLKRYTDPSSFKAESTTSDAAILEARRERRARRMKKRGSRWRNGDTPEVLTTSHAKLHQLLLEDRIGNESKVPARHVKLKKKILDGSKSSKSYMEKFLQSMSPEHSETYETEVGQPTLRLTYNDIDSAEREVLDIQPVSAIEDSHYHSTTDQETRLRPSVMYSYDFSKSRRNKGSTLSLEDDNSIGTASPLRIPVTEKELGVDRENRHANGITSSHSDDIASETENYMDALANMESEADTDNEYIPKKELRYFSKHAGVHESKEQDSQSVDISMISDDGSMSFVKGGSSSSLRDAPNEEHGEQEAESSLSTRTCEAVMVSDAFDHDKTRKTTSYQYWNNNGEIVGSIGTPYYSEAGDTSLHKDSAQLMQSSESGLSFRPLPSPGAYLNMANSQGMYDSDHPQGERNIENGVTDTTPDGPCEDDNVSVIRSLVEKHDSVVSSEVLTSFSNDLSHDHFKSSSMVENETLHRRRADELFTENLGEGEILSHQSTKDEQQSFDQGDTYRDSCSQLIVSADEHVDNNHAIVLKDVNYIGASGMDSTQETHESFLVETDATAFESSAGDDGCFAAKKEPTATELLSESPRSEDHASSDKLSFQTSLIDDVAVKSDFNCNNDYGLGVNLEQGNDEEAVFQSGSITQRNEDLQTEKEVNLEGVHLLPPLPPVQWIVGKPQDSLLDLKGESEGCIMTSNGTSSPFNSHFMPVDGEQPLMAAQSNESSIHKSSHYPRGLALPSDSILQAKDTIDVQDQHSSLMSEKNQPDYAINHPRTYLESGQPHAFSGGTPETSLGSCLPTSSTDADAFSAEAIQPPKETSQLWPAEHMVHSAGETTQPSAALESTQPPLGNTIVGESSTSEVPMNSTHPSLEYSNSYGKAEQETLGKRIGEPSEVCSPQIQNDEQQKQEIKSSERVATWSLALRNYEDQKLAIKPVVKPPRPKNPLIESVDALDRRKLKKVTPRNRSEIPTSDGRSSLLEQIRAKSFNLKPASAPVAKPIIQAPTMNLKVAAILEKANKIRRATAGSDDEDDDNWSDD